MATLDTYYSNLFLINRKLTYVTNIRRSPYSAFFKVNIAEKSFRCPAFLISDVCDIRSGKYTDIVCPIIKSENNVQLKTVTSAFKTFFTCTGPRSLFYHVIMQNNISYYGHDGFILDSNCNPLLIPTLRVNFNNDDTLHSVDSPEFWVSYRVINSSDPIEKNIMKRLLPLVGSVSTGFQFHVYVPKLLKTFDEPAKIIIDNYDDYIVKPKKPSMAAVNQESFNKVILDNVC